MQGVPIRQWSIIMSKKWLKWILLLGILTLQTGIVVNAQGRTSGVRPPAGYRVAGSAESGTICDGIYAGSIDLSGMSAAEAENAINEYVESCESAQITLRADAEHEIVVSAADLGIRWGNPEIVDAAVNYGVKGNIVSRYKQITDLNRENQVYEIVFEFDKDAIQALIDTQSEEINIEAQNPGLTREDEEFIIIPGVTGLELDVAASVDAVYHYLTEEWTLEADGIVELAVNVTEPDGSEEDLALVQDVLASFTTSFSTSDSSRSANVRNASGKVNGTLLFPGEEFSTLAVIAPFTTDNGYYPAGSYIAGKVVDSVGGGICQVSTTLYNAVLLSELEITYRTNHAMAVTYVNVGMDATVSEDSGIDFKFRNNTDYPIYIESYTTPNKQITMTIYGVETRPEGHQVSYESTIVSVTQPGPEVIYADASQPVGYIDVQPPHTGYVADVFRIITEDGVVVSREQISHDTYKMTSRSATVGIATGDPTTYSVMEAAIATGNVDYVRAVVYQLATGTYAGPIPGAEQSVPADAEPAGTDPAAPEGENAGGAGQSASEGAVEG